MGVRFEPDRIDPAAFTVQQGVQRGPGEDENAETENVTGTGATQDTTAPNEVAAAQDAETDDARGPAERDDANPVLGESTADPGGTLPGANLDLIG